MKTFNLKERKEFIEAAKPMIKWLNENTHPHSRVSIDHTHAELVGSQLTMKTEEFLKD